ncbi:hypothetical protein ACSNOK_00580 [Streptomyces sp. URMC 126]|uniref:hypothetical protein n=1 Tax=Streptomyces sp. URMC 126 TaxID=3423401 RepID=UPI003F1933F9
MSTMPRFDQRAVALIELRGTGCEHEEFERALTDQGWKILERRGALPSGVAEGHSWYVIEVRFPGSRINAVRGARERIEALSDKLVLELNVGVVDRVDRDPVNRPHWSAYERPNVHPLTTSLPWRRRLADRWRLWQAEKLGVRDTGRLITASSALSAQHLAVRHLPGTVTPPGRISVRGPMGATPRGVNSYGRRREFNRRMSWLTLLVMVAVWVGARLADRYAHGFASWAWLAGMGVVIAFALAKAVTHAAPGMPRAKCLLVSGGLTLGAAALGAQLARTAPIAGYGSRAIFYLAVAGLLCNGIRMLVRQWSWQRTASWLLPALLPIGLGFLPSLGLGLHAFYLDAFGLNSEDVEIPKFWEFLASSKLAACMSLELVALALLGYLKHFHLYVKDRWYVTLVVLALGLCLLAYGMGDLGLVSAGRAGSKAVAEAKKGNTPSAYFGIKPEWVCVHPIGKVSDVPVDGGELVPVRPYLQMGDSGGTVVLWDSVEGEAIKVPMSKLRIVPVGRRPESCA